MMNKTIIIMMAMILMMPLVIAATDTNDIDDIFKLDSYVTYSKPCFNNGTYCSRSAACNYTIFKPDNSILVNDTEASNNYNSYDISFTVTSIGIYKVDMVCTDGSLKGAETFYFEVTGSGFHNTIWFYVLVLGISAGIMVLGFNLSDPPIVILGTFGLYFIGIYTLINGVVGIKDLATTWAVGLILIAVASYISIKSGWELING